MSDEYLIGSGWFNWPRYERVTDRYGLVGLWSRGMETPTSASGDFLELDIPGNLIGSHGQLVARVLETARSQHIGDLFHGFFPETPEVGEVIELGVGWLFTEAVEGQRYVGLRPDEERGTFWLNPQMLYRAHDQRVDLLFRSTPKGGARREA